MTKDDELDALESMYRLGVNEREVLEGAYRLGAKPAPVPIEGGSGDFWVELAGVRVARLAAGSRHGYIGFAWAGVFEDLAGQRGSRGGRPVFREWTWEQALHEITAAIEHRFGIR